MASFKDHSKTNWTPSPDTADYPGHERVMIGCMQRIADATEKMAGNYTALQNNVDWYKRREKDNRAQIERLVRSNAALRGHIKRLKKKPDK